MLPKCQTRVLEIASFRGRVRFGIRFRNSEEKGLNISGSALRLLVVQSFEADGREFCSEASSPKPAKPRPILVMKA